LVLANRELLAKDGTQRRVVSSTHAARTTFHFSDGSEASVGNESLVRQKMLATKAKAKPVRHLSDYLKAKKPAPAKAKKATKRLSPKRAQVQSTKKAPAKAEHTRQAALEALKDAWLAQYKTGPTTSVAAIQRISEKISAAMNRVISSGATATQINEAMNSALAESRKPKTRRPASSKPRKAPPKRKERKAPPKRKERKAPKPSAKKAPDRRVVRVFIDQPDAMAIMTTLEGRQWGRKQERDKFDVRGFYSNLDAYRHLAEANLTNADVSLSDILAGSGQIDGTKNSIYFVHANGEVTLQYGTANAQKRDRAQNLGMRVEHGEMSNPVEDDSNLDIEMETGALISESSDGYAIAVENEFIASAQTVDEALETLRDWMGENKYWPNVYFVNERGNVDQLDVATGETIASWV
jgi:hypothetical protein